LTTTNSTPTAIPAPAERTHGTFKLEVTDARDVLARVVVTLHRRDCQITRLEFKAPSGAAGGTLELEADVPSSQAHCVEHWMRRLLDVTAVSGTFG
jgi:hypothetical protein